MKYKLTYLQKGDLAIRKTGLYLQIHNTLNPEQELLMSQDTQEKKKKKREQ